MAKQDFAALEDNALVAKLEEIQRQLLDARFALSLGKLENTASVGGIRKDLARVNTELRKREISKGLGKGALAREHRGAGGTQGGKSADGGSASFLQSVVDKAAE